MTSLIFLNSTSLKFGDNFVYHFITGGLSLDSHKPKVPLSIFNENTKQSTFLMIHVYFFMFVSRLGGFKKG
jgi:hypothetical protein